MKRIVAVTFCALMLAGCAESFDRAAVPNAAADMHRATALCALEHYASYSKSTACELAAERDFAVAIGFRKMDAFEAYASRMRALAMQRDDFQIGPDEARMRVAAIRKDFIADCGCTQHLPRAGRSTGEAWVGFGPEPGGGAPPFINSGPGTYVPPVVTN